MKKQIKSINNTNKKQLNKKNNNKEIISCSSNNYKSKTSNIESSN